MRRLLFFFALAAGLLAAPALAGAATFTVHPNGHNDTADIQRAFGRAIAAGPASVVKLSAGHFYTNTIVVKGFHGYFTGAGEGKTVIDTLRGNPKTPDAAPVTVVPGYSYPTLLLFVGGFVHVSDLSIDVTATSPAQWNNFGTPADFLMMDVWVTGNASSSFDHVGFIAGPGNDVFGFNTDEGVVISGVGPLDANGASATIWVTRGRDSVRDCSFAGPQDGLQIMGLTDGTATVTGNVFDDANFCCMVNDASAAHVAISHNQMTAHNGNIVVLWQGFQAFLGGGAPLPPAPGCSVVVSHNSMLAVHNGGGPWVEDDALPAGLGSRLHATFADNTITLDNGGYDAGIDGICARGVRVVHNRISGTGLAAIDLGTDMFTSFGFPSGPTSDWQIVDNDVSGLTASTADGGPGAQIWLGPHADHCLVVGGPKSTTVLDQGTHDTLINVTKLPDPPAVAVSGVFRKLETLKEMKRL